MAFNKKTLFTLCAIAASFSLAPVASAQLYKWTDENGKVHYSDTVPPSANDRARKEIRSDGVVKGQVERALTLEERRAAAQRAAEEEKTRVAKEERERKDKALLATYATLADFDRVRDRAIAQADAEITALQKQEVNEAAQRAELQKQVDALGKKPAPIKLKGDLADAERELGIVREQIQKKSKDRGALVSSYQTERARLAELIAAEAAVNKPASSTAPAALPAKKKS